MEQIQNFNDNPNTNGLNGISGDEYKSQLDKMISKYKSNEEEIKRVKQHRLKEEQDEGNNENNSNSFNKKNRENKINNNVSIESNKQKSPVKNVKSSILDVNDPQAETTESQVQKSQVKSQVKSQIVKNNSLINATKDTSDSFSNKDNVPKISLDSRKSSKKDTTIRNDPKESKELKEPKQKKENSKESIKSNNENDINDKLHEKDV